MHQMPLLEKPSDMQIPFQGLLTLTLTVWSILWCITVFVIRDHLALLPTFHHLYSGCTCGDNPLNVLLLYTIHPHARLLQDAPGEDWLNFVMRVTKLFTTTRHFLTELKSRISEKLTTIKKIIWWTSRIRKLTAIDVVTVLNKKKG
jgi:hypothetical protein